MNTLGNKNSDTVIAEVIRGVNQKWLIFDYDVKNLAFHRDNVDFLKSDVLLGFFYKNKMYETDQIEAFFSNINYVEEFSRVHFVDKAVQILYNALVSKKHIVVFSDYDVDGINSAAHMAKFLDSIGYVIDFDYTIIINERKYGYDINSYVFERMKHHDGALIIVLDSGTSACYQITRLLHSGKDVIVIDHHEPSTDCFIQAIAKEYPNFAIVNPKAGSDVSYYDSSPTAVLVYYFLEYFCSKHPILCINFESEKYLDIFSTPIISDYMRWNAVNKSLVNLLYNAFEKKSVNSLYKRIIKDVNISAESFHKELSFRLVPMINAMGRYNEAGEAFYMMYGAIASDSYDIERAYSKLEIVNNRRKQEQTEYKEKINNFIKNKYRGNIPNFVIINLPHVDRGLLSNLAGSVASQIGRPIFLVTLVDGKWEGSGRAPRHLDRFLDILRDNITDQALRVNGHQSAFGVSIKNTDEQYLLDLEKRISDVLEPYKLVLDPNVGELDGEIKNAKDVRDIIDNIHLFIPANHQNKSAYLVRNYQLNNNHIIIDGEKYPYYMENYRVYLSNEHNMDLIVRPTLINGAPGFIVIDSVIQ